MFRSVLKVDPVTIAFKQRLVPELALTSKCSVRNANQMSNVGITRTIDKKRNFDILLLN